MKSLTSTEIKRLNRLWRRGTGAPIRLALVSLANPFNVGSILRTAAVVAVDCVYLVGATPGPDDPKVHKTALGTERSVPSQRVETLAGAVRSARADGFQIVALELATGATPLFAADLEAPTCLVIGSEAHGLTAASLAECDAAVYVPQPGKVASLNVATATGIALYELRRREWAPRSVT